MKIFEGFEGMYRFKLLPDFAKYILENKLVDYIKESLRLSKKMDLPILKFLSSWSEEQLIEHSKITSAEYLTYLVEGRAKEEIEDSMKKWMADQLDLIGKNDILAEDITMIIYIRGRSLKKFIPHFTTDFEQTLEIIEEIDTFNLGELTTATDTYINILKDKIQEEVNFKKKLVNTSPGMVYVYDLEQKEIVYSNDKAVEILGYSKEDLKKLSGNYLADISHPDDIEKVAEHLQCFKHLEDGESCSLEHRVKDTNGMYRWIRNYETIFKKNEYGQPTQIIGAAYDITKERKISEDLQHREAQLVDAQQIAKIGSFEWDFIENKANNTKQFYKIFEYDGIKHFEDFLLNIHPDDQDKVAAAYKESMQTGIYECEYRYVVEGREKYIWSRGFVQFENGAPSKMIGTVQDITDRRKIEEIILQKTIELEKRNADLTEFTYVASHDLKEPLRKISLYCDMIAANEAGTLSNDSKKQFEKIIDASKRMQTMIEDILTLSSLSIDKSKEWHNLQHILEDTEQMLEHTIKEKNATITSQQLPEAYIVPSLFRQLFLNIISNSLKFAKKDVPAEISITCNYLTNKKTFTQQQEEAAYLQLIFTDNGIGFNRESADKIFQLFQRLHNRSEYEGSGLGLAITKKIVEEHNGTITATSEPGKGASFVITIPLN